MLKALFLLNLVSGKGDERVTWLWKELLPVDQFSVRMSQYITEIDRLTLTILYQPLIGAVAHSLYMTLLAQLERDEYWGAAQTHRQLMLMLGVSLEVIYEERKKLEAIGLLKTFKRNDEGEAAYVYELQPPMTPKQFFENDVLGVYLFNRVGKTHYLQLRERFTLAAVKREEYTELTHAFDEVFTSLKHSEMVSNLQSETGNALQIEPDQEVVSSGGSDQADLLFMHQQFDFPLLEASLAKSVIPKGGLSAEAKQLIGRLAFVYQIEPLAMSDLVEQVLLHTEELDPEALRKKVQDWYKIEQGTTPPALGLRTQPENHRTMGNRKPETEEERAIQFYEMTPPLTLLEIRSVGAQVAPADIKVIESLILDYKLLPGVVNVLIDFVLYSNDMKLPKALIHKIAGHWARKKVKTVQEAMKLALSEQKKEEAATNKNSYRSVQKQPRRDELPQWLIAEKEKEKDEAGKQKERQQQEQPASSSEQEKSFEQMLEELKKIKERKR